jgi:hypothetical protein
MPEGSQDTPPPGDDDVPLCLNSLKKGNHMGYMHIPNLYSDQGILMSKECYALEKIHGTSANISWRDGHVIYSSGGEKHERFRELFDEEKLTAAFVAIGHPIVTVYGEAYGGKQQAQSWRYGKELRFVAFEVQVGDTWLAVPNAANVSSKLGLEFVHYKRISTDLAAVDAERDAPSEQAKRNGVEGSQPREGVVLRPLEELVASNGHRLMAKHKRDEERETKTTRQVSPDKFKVLQDAQAIADEWVTPTRLEHVLDKLGPVGVEQTRDVIGAMIEDVEREGAAEIVVSQEARRAIGSATAKMFKARLQKALQAA